MALTASAPIFRGYLADYDVRWYTISASVDDRTPEERGLEVGAGELDGTEPSRHTRLTTPSQPPLWRRHSRCPSPASGSTSRGTTPSTATSRRTRRCCPSTTTSTWSLIRPSTSACGRTVGGAARSGRGPRVVRRLTGYECWRAIPLWPGVDHLLARHIAHLFIRDPLAIYKELLDQDDTKSSDHFEVGPGATANRFVRAYALADHSVVAAAAAPTRPTEHPIHQLADNAVQAAAAQQLHRLARRVSVHGGAADRL